MTRTEIIVRLVVLAKMVKDGDETTVEIDEALEAIEALKQLENFQDGELHPDEVYST